MVILSGNSGNDPVQSPPECGSTWQESSQEFWRLPSPGWQCFVHPTVLQHLRYDVCEQISFWLNTFSSPLNQNIARIANAVHCHSCLSCNPIIRNPSTIVIHGQCNLSTVNPSTRNLSTIVIYPQCNSSIWNLSTRNLSTIVIYPQCNSSTM